MTLNHSKTWPVSTLAVVQLRVDPNGRTYSTQMDVEIPQANILGSDNDKVRESERVDARKDEQVEKNGGVVLPLSQRHVEMFTKNQQQRHPLKKTVRTDTVSTILEQDFDLDSEATAVSKSIPDEDLANLKKRDFHVLALARIDESANDEPEFRSRRPSVKIENWDLIYTERDAKKGLCPVCSGRTVNGGEYPNRKSPNDYNDRLLSDYDLPLDARKVTTLRRHYYPEGGWGWVIIACATLVHILNVGVQLSCSQLVLPGAEKFKTLPVHIAGEFRKFSITKTK